MPLIELSDAVKVVDGYKRRNPDSWSLCNSIRCDIEELSTLSPDDVRGVVRCKDCTFGEHETDGDGNPCVLCENSMVFDYPYAHDPDWFCADGERMKGVSEDTRKN